MEWMDYDWEIDRKVARQGVEPALNPGLSAYQYFRAATCTSQSFVPTVELHRGGYVYALPRTVSRPAPPCAAGASATPT